MVLKVMLSSVRRAGLGDIRDVIAPVIKILGYEVVRFEDVLGGSLPSRAVCVDLVEKSDIYLLLLGAEYGEAIAGTGLAPTDEEWTIARNRGKPIVVFRQSGVTFEPAQQAFISKVGDYETGVWHYSFRDAKDLIPQLEEALARAADELRPTAPRPLTQAVVVPWREANRGIYASGGTVLETHVIPVGAASPLAAAAFRELDRSLARAGQDHGLFEMARGLDSDTSPNAVTVRAKPDGRGPEAALRVSRDRTVSVWESLPSEEGQFGAFLNEAQFRDRVARDLRLVASLGVITAEDAAVAVGFEDVSMLGIPGRGSSVSLPFAAGGSRAVHTEPAEAWPTRLLAIAADQIATELVANLMLRLRP